MIKAEYTDKELAVDILSKSFDDNKSVNYIIKQDGKRDERIRRLMEYSFEVCYSFGKVFFSDDKKGCALIVLPDKKKTTARSVLFDLKLILSGIGLSHVKKAMSREAKIKELQPKEPMYYLWFIGVLPDQQSTGTGSRLMKEIISESERDKRMICLETSTLKNLPWYQKFSFTIYNELDLLYKLYFLKREAGK